MRIDRIAQLVTFYATTAQIDQALNEALALQAPAFLSMPRATVLRTLTSSNFAAM
jgi:purine nucleoside permease